MVAFSGFSVQRGYKKLWEKVPRPLRMGRKPRQGADKQPGKRPSSQGCCHLALAQGTGGSLPPTGSPKTHPRFLKLTRGQVDGVLPGRAPCLHGRAVNLLQLHLAGRKKKHEKMRI